MRNSQNVLVFVSCMTFFGVSLADSTAESLTQIEAETAVLKARAKKLEVQAQIANKRAEIDRLSGSSASNASLGDPEVWSVEGVGENVYVTLRFENGRLVDAREGDTLPNGMKVVSIRANEVIVEKWRGKKASRVRLSTAGTAGPLSSGAGVNSVGVPLPPIYPSGGELR